MLFHSDLLEGLHSISRQDDDIYVLLLLNECFNLATTMMLLIVKMIVQFYTVRTSDHY